MPTEGWEHVGAPLFQRVLVTDVGKGPVVKVVVADVRYAVIEAFQTEGGPERFVLAYRNEQSFRDLVAAPCIAAFGFSLRRGCCSQDEGQRLDGHHSKQTRRTAVVRPTEER